MFRCPANYFSQLDAGNVKYPQSEQPVRDRINNVVASEQHFEVANEKGLATLQVLNGQGFAGN